MYRKLWLMCPLFFFLLSSLTVVSAGDGQNSVGKNPFTPKAALIRYWNKQISNREPKPPFLIDKASPLTAVDAVAFAKLAAKNRLADHLQSFCAAANLLCFPDPSPSLEKHDKDANFAVYANHNFTNYATGRQGGLDSFKNYSEDLNLILDSFRRYSRDAAGHNEKFDNYGTNTNVPDQRFNSYGSGATKGKGEFKNYNEGVNVPNLSFNNYGSESKGRAHSFSIYTDETNHGNESFTSYGKNGNSSPNEFINYADNSNVIVSGFDGYGEGAKAANDTFTKYGQDGNEPGNDFKSYGKGANGANDTFTNYGDDSNVPTSNFKSYDANDTFTSYGFNGNVPENTFKSYRAGGNGASHSFASYRDQSNIGDDSFQSYAKDPNSTKVTFSNYGKSFNEGTEKFTGYGQGAQGQSIGFKEYGVNNTFKDYADKKQVSFASYTTRAEAIKDSGRRVNRWVEPGKFFRESMLKKGTSMPMPDIRSFLPRTISSKLPFATSKLAEMKRIFHAADNSSMESMMVSALSDCEREPSPGETKSCVGSVEDMIDFATSVLGRNVVVRSTESVAGSKQEILIGQVRGINGGKVTKSVSCHQSLFPYLLYYCHSVPKVRVYSADLLNPKSKAKINHGVAICHLDTSAWSATHGAFLALGYGPGKIEVCHWIFENDMTWTTAD